MNCVLPVACPLKSCDSNNSIEELTSEIYLCRFSLSGNPSQKLGHATTRSMERLIDFHSLLRATQQIFMEVKVCSCQYSSSRKG